jgi:hypothetical protein
MPGSKRYGEYGDAATDLSKRSRSNGLPLGLVAIEKGRAAGTLAIAEPVTLSHPQLTPWIVGFWVETARRKSAIGTRLLKPACVWAWTAEFEHLHAATASLLFLREGSHRIDVS